MPAFRASYADWKLIKTRGCVQIVFELPVEQSDAAYQLLGGMPVAAREVWCGIARLNGKEGDAVAERSRQASSVSRNTVDTPPRLESNASAGADKERRKFDELPPPQQAGILCNSEAFQQFLREKFPQNWRDSYAFKLAGEWSVDDAAAWTVRDLCGVESRAHIKPDNTEWLSLLLAYRLWQNHPELEDA